MPRSGELAPVAAPATRLKAIAMARTSAPRSRSAAAAPASWAAASAKRAGVRRRTCPSGMRPSSCANPRAPAIVAAVAGERPAARMIGTWRASMTSAATPLRRVAISSRWNAWPCQACANVARPDAVGRGATRWSGTRAAASRNARTGQSLQRRGGLSCASSSFARAKRSAAGRWGWRVRRASLGARLPANVRSAVRRVLWPG